MASNTGEARELSPVEIEGLVLWAAGRNPSDIVTDEALELLVSHPILRADSDEIARLRRSSERLRQRLRSRCFEVSELFDWQTEWPEHIHPPDDLEKSQMVDGMRILFSTSPSALVERRKKIGQIGTIRSPAHVNRHYEEPMSVLAVHLLMRQADLAGDLRQGVEIADEISDNTTPTKALSPEPGVPKPPGNGMSVLRAVVLLFVLALLVGALVIFSQSGQASEEFDSLGPSRDDSMSRCGPVNLRSAQPIPGAVNCANGKLVNSGALDVGWNGRISAWQIDGAIEARATWENWDDGTPDPSGINIWLTTGHHVDTEGENDRYQELEIFARAGGSLTIWENFDKSGASVTFQYQEDGNS